MKNKHIIYNSAKSKIGILMLLLSMLSFSTLQAQDQPTTPITPLQEAFNQYTKLLLNSADGITTYTDNTLLNNGTMNTFTEFVFDLEIDHFAATLIPIADYASADLDFTLQLDGVDYTMKMTGGNQLELANGTAIYNGDINVDDVIRIGYDDLMVLFMINEDILHTEIVTEVPEEAKAILTPITANDASFYFYFDVEFRNSSLFVNFVEDESTIQEGDPAHLCIDLTSENTTPDDITVTISIQDPKEIHFTSVIDVTVAIPPGSAGEVCVDIPSELPNTLQDENVNYLFEIIAVDGMNTAIGDRNTHRVTVIDDYEPYNNSLAPGDLMFVGLETDIGMGEDQIVITNLVELNPGTKFQITNARYRALDDKFLACGFNGFSSTQFEYIGTEPLPANSRLCIYTGDRESTDRTYVSLIEVDGVEANSSFELTNKGSSSLNSIEVDMVDSKGLFLVQGIWSHSSLQESHLNGKVIHAIRMGEDFSVDVFPAGCESNEHVDVECLVTNDPNLMGSGWAYFQCQLPYNRITVFDMQAQISDFSNWNSGNGDDQVNWPIGVDVCISTCDIGEYDPLAITVDDVTVYCDGQPDPNGEIAAWLEDQLKTSVTGGAYAVTVTATPETVLIDPEACNTYDVTFTATDGAGETVSAIGTVSVLDVTAPVFQNDTPSNENLQCSEQFDMSPYVTDECGEVIITSSKTLISSVPNDHDIVEVTFVATDACGNSSSFVQTQEITQGQFTIEITDPDNGELMCSDADGFGYNNPARSTITGSSGYVSFNWKYTDLQGNTVRETTYNSNSDNNEFSLTNMYDRPSGVISVTATQNGCTAYDEVSVVGSDFKFAEDYQELEFCGNIANTINAVPINGSGNYSYQWMNGNNFLDDYGNDENYLDWNSGMSAYIRLLAIDENGCAAVKYFNITNYDQTLTLSGPDLECPNTQVTLNSTYSENDNDDATSVKWHKDEGSGYNEITNGASDNQLTTIVSTNTTFKFEVIYESGCVFSEEIFVETEPEDPAISPSNIHENTNNGYGWRGILAADEVIFQNIIPFRYDFNGSSNYFLGGDPASFAQLIEITGNMGRHNASSIWYSVGANVVNDFRLVHCFEIPESGDYAMGFGVDNIGWVEVDGERIFDLTTNNGSGNGRFPWEYWWLTQVELEAGNHELEIYAENFSATARSVGYEVYSEDLNSVLSYSSAQDFDDHVIASSSELRNTQNTDNISHYVIGAEPCTCGMYFDNDCILRCQCCGNNSSFKNNIIHSFEYDFTIGNLAQDSSFTKSYSTVSQSLLTIYPNPTTDRFYLEYNSETDQIVDLQLYKMSGELVRSSKLELVEGMNVNEVDTQDLVPAMYLVKLRTTDQEFIEKVVIVKN